VNDPAVASETTPEPIRVGTHSGSFHADEVFALATLRMALGPIEIVRTRTAEKLETCAMRVDVGRRYDPATGDFDHHQGDVGERENGIRYASFGLVWKHYGEGLAGSAEVAASVDGRVVTPIDAGDNGQELYDPLVDGVQPYAVSGVIASMNPPWDAQDGAAAERAAFDEAVDLAEGIIRRELEASQGRARAADLVRTALARATNPAILELDRGMPWRGVVRDEGPEVLFVVSPRSRGDWSLQAVPAGDHGFANRRSLPESWAGLEGEALQQVTGVDDAVFCHVARFMAVAGSRDGVLELARQALTDAPAAGTAPTAG
jgi:uncharacterized UPF0160 family protein